MHMKNLQTSITPQNDNRVTVLVLCLSSGPSCSKLTMSSVNDSLKFTSSDTQIF